MRRILAISLLIILVPAAALADEKAKALAQIDAAKASITAFARRAGDNKSVAGELEKAQALLKQSEEAFLRGKPVLIGDLNPDAARDVKHYTELAELQLAVGQSRLEKEKAAEELKELQAQIGRIKGRSKIFADRIAELEKLRAKEAMFNAVLKEVEALKAENAKILDREAKLAAERTAFAAEIERLKADLAKRPAPPASVAEAAPRK